MLLARPRRRWLTGLLKVPAPPFEVAAAAVKNPEPAAPDEDPAAVDVARQPPPVTLEALTAHIHASCVVTVAKLYAQGSPERAAAARVAVARVTAAAERNSDGVGAGTTSGAPNAYRFVALHDHMRAQHRR